MIHQKTSKFYYLHLPSEDDNFILILQIALVGLNPFTNPQISSPERIVANLYVTLQQNA